MKMKTGTMIAAGALLAAAAFIAMACGGGGGGAKSTPQPSATVAQTGPGTITLSSSAITGQSGKILLVFAIPEGGAGPLARVCASITSGSFTLDSTVMTDMAAGQDSCSGSTPKTEFPEGTYMITAGVYVPPSQTAEVKSQQTVRVSGDVTVEIDGAALSQ